MGVRTPFPVGAMPTGIRVWTDGPPLTVAQAARLRQPTARSGDRRLHEAATAADILSR